MTAPTLDGDQTLAAADAVQQETVSSDLVRGDTVGRYLVLRTLGRGGMGTVYAAHDPELDRTVALKIVRQRGSGGAQLKEEAQALARLSHRNVVTVHDVGDLEDGVFIAMGYVQGATLRVWSEEHRDDMAALAKVMRAAGRGLAAAHAQSLVHLDFKPDNVMIGDDGRAVVLDFGLAQLQDRAGGGTEVTPLGTPAYMPPEQHRREALDACADQFAFCATWLECALGRRAFPGKSPASITRAILEGETQLPARPASIPRATWHALLRGISTKPADRWPDMKTLLAETAPSRRSRWQTAVAVVFAGSLGAGAMWMVSGDSRNQCRRAASKVVGAWSQADHNTLAARGGETAAGLSQDRVSAISAGLDRYADALAEAYTEACRVAPEDTPRKVCLDGRLEQLRASRDLAIDGAGGELQRVLEPLQDVRYCRRADEDALYHEVSDPTRAQAVLRRLAQARSWVDAGRNDAASAELHSVLADAAALGWKAVESLARTELATLAGASGDAAESELQFTAALKLASEAGSDLATSIALARRLQAYALNGDAVAVVVLAPAVRAAALRAGLPGASVEIALGNVHQLTGDYQAAEAAYEKAIALPDVPLRTRLRAQSNLGALELYRGKFRRARTRFEEVAAALQERDGATSVARLKALANLADAEHQLGDEVSALAHYAEALQRYQEVGAGATRPAEHLKLNYSFALAESGALQRAEETGVPAAHRMLELHGEQHVFSIAARDFMNALARAQGRHSEALASTQLLMTDLEAMFGLDNPVAAVLCVTGAESALATGRTELGLELLRKGEPLLVSLNPEHPFLVPLYRLRSELQLQELDTDASIIAGAEAVLRASGASVHPIERGRAYLALAKARLARGDIKADVQADLERAAKAFGRQPKHQHARVDEVAMLLATPSPLRETAEWGELRRSR
ncbi:MAG: serine/threonine-protein kinase [Nannocystaceae bacterium]|nr:serine/threonine-protein kinase [Nannocystaceae bacterium]